MEAIGTLYIHSNLETMYGVINLKTCHNVQCVMNCIILFFNPSFSTFMEWDKTESIL